jgi:hypothetical protein
MRRHTTIYVFLVIALVGTVSLVRAQDPSYPATDPQAAPQPAAQQSWSPQQLDNLVAPIALFPDPLLGQILVASTYPIEVVEANQWLQRNRNLRGQALVDAAKQQPWDPSIQALVAVPDALTKLNQDIRWTTDLGNAFLAQQADVMNAVQRMRAGAQSNGRLASTPQQTVTTQDEGGQKSIVIQPADPQVIYVPTYDPYYVWGPPVYGYYPPLLYPYYGFGFGIGWNLGFYFGPWGAWGYWGWYPSWFGHSVYCHNNFFHHYGYPYHQGFWGGGHGNAAWAHNPVHRMNVPYSSAHVAARFGGNPVAARNGFRAGNAPRTAMPPNGSRSAGPVVNRSFAQRSPGSAPQSQRGQNPPRQSYQSGQQYRSTPQQSRETTRVVPFGGQSRGNLQTPQQFRSAPQVSQAPQVQRFQAQPQMRSQAAPQQFRPAPQFSAPRSSGGGGFSRGGGASFSHSGGGAGFSHGGGGGSRGGGGGSGHGGGHR